MSLKQILVYSVKDTTFQSIYLQGTIDDSILHMLLQSQKEIEHKDKIRIKKYCISNSRQHDASGIWQTRHKVMLTS